MQVKSRVEEVMRSRRRGEISTDGVGVCRAGAVVQGWGRSGVDDVWVRLDVEKRGKEKRGRWAMLAVVVGGREREQGLSWKNND